MDPATDYFSVGNNNQMLSVITVTRVAVSTIILQRPPSWCFAVAALRPHPNVSTITISPTSVAPPAAWELLLFTLLLSIPSTDGTILSVCD